MYYVYRYMIGDQWIYVGKADAHRTRDELQNRIREHSHDKRFRIYPNAIISYCILENASDMNAVETMLIKIHNPIINVVSKTKASLPFRYDPNMITWFPIDDFVRHRKSSEEEIQLDKLRSLILQSFYNSNPTCSLRHSSDIFDCKIGLDLFNMFCDYLESSPELNYPCCEAEFDLSFNDIIIAIDYKSNIKPPTLSKKIKESIKNAFPDNKLNWYSIQIDRNEDIFHFKVLHGVYVYRDFIWNLESIIDTLPKDIVNGEVA